VPPAQSEKCHTEAQRGPGSPEPSVRPHEAHCHWASLSSMMPTWQYGLRVYVTCAGTAAQGGRRHDGKGGAERAGGIPSEVSRALLNQHVL